MAEDEQKDLETPQDSEAQDSEQQDEGAPAAGPDAASEAPDLTRSDTSESTPPAEESAEADAGDEAAEVDEDEAPEAEDEKAEEEPVAPVAAEKKPEEKKKDVIPGADLEPIAVEPDERPLSAEEQARREAEEEEERARREAELAVEAEPEVPASRAPAKLDGDARFLATGKRKHAIARVILVAGKGEFEVNGRSIEEFFPRPLHQTIARQPLASTGYDGSLDVRVRVHGGGVSGQAGAIRHGIARALIEVDPELRGELKRRGFLTRDARVKERRKAGLKKARKRPQFSKR